MDNHPFNFCENELTRQNTNLQDFSAHSLVCYLEKITEKREQKIKEILPEKFSLICDGRSSGPDHYFGIFASFYDKISGNQKTYFLALSLLLDDERFDAKNHFEFIVSMLENYFGKSISNVMGIVCDNASVMKTLSKLLKIPMIGCPSQRPNLAAEVCLETKKSIITKM